MGKRKIDAKTTALALALRFVLRAVARSQDIEDYDTWIEIATEPRDTLHVVPMPGSVMLMTKKFLRIYPIYKEYME